MANVNVYLDTLRLKGYLAYEYNPFYNYQTDVDLSMVDGFLIPYGLAINPKNGELLTKKKVIQEQDSLVTEVWVDKRGNIFSSDQVKAFDSSKIYAKAGSLIDLDTDKLNFDIKHPVDITILPSYDGSVNLILNDDKNIPRLINSRFSVREKNTYEIVDRIGENDTNIYNSKTFDKDTSLYFLYEYNPIVSYQGFTKGNLLVGLYCFYFTYCDADDNESDYIAESGLVPVFIGSDRDPNSIDGGIKNQNSFKGIRLRLSNLDKSYNYLKIYYVRYFADYNQNRVSECKKIIKKYPINSNILYVQITGNELTEDIDANILNISRFNPHNILTQAQCKNMLFFGNIVKNSDNYTELSDCALRIVPEVVPQTFEPLKWDYTSNNGQYAYYNSVNVYNNVGYFDQEYYRFGVVFIYLNGTLSNVYNTLGCELKTYPNLADKLVYKSGSLFDSKSTVVLNRSYIEIDDEGWVKNYDNHFGGIGINLNSRGVCKFNYKVTNDNTILGIKFSIPKEVIDYLKEDLGIRGMFFVRQKCMPNILALCYLLPMDDQLKAPVLEVLEVDKTYHYTECFVSLDDKREVTHDYMTRRYEYKHDKKDDDSDNAISANAYAAICPDFLLNLPYYNQIFNGSKFKIQKISSNSNLHSNSRIYYENESVSYSNSGEIKQVIINTVTEAVPTVAIKDKTFKTEIGLTEESYRFEYCEIDNGVLDMGGGSSSDDINKCTNVVRGIYSPYLAIYSDSKLSTSALYNIYQDVSQGESQEYKIRMDSKEPFYSISDRYNFDGLAGKDDSVKTLVCWRGDCYINNFTYRLNRNFNDPSLPNNDVIIDRNTWKKNYKIEDLEAWKDISRSDLNAVQMGSWITIKVRSSMNYALRSLDHSFVSEEALMGSPRSYYPRNQVMWLGANKMPDSYLYNDAYRASLGFKCYFAIYDINYIKDTFSNRILYSAIAIQDSFKNNYRDSLSVYFRDYSQEYGSIQKLVGFEGYLLVVFEHAIGIAVINERILAGSGDGEPVFINSKNVLPEELTIVSDTYGTQWGDSVVKSEAGYVYGVDTIAKKIWRVKGELLEILSDFKVNKFLVDNITLGERELYPIIGLKNVKTHYNNNKKDVIFTFYDDIYKDEEKVWSLCYNELLGEFITFYSWVPSYSENIDTLFFTFDRNSSKELSLLNQCNYAVEGNTGVLLDTPILKVTRDNDQISISSSTLYYKVKKTKSITNSIKDNYKITEESEVLSGVTFTFEKDHWGNNNWFTISDSTLSLNSEVSYLEILNTLKERNTGVILLWITPTISNSSSITSDTYVKEQLGRTQMVAVTFSEIVDNLLLTAEDKLKPDLTTDFYLHGLAGLMDIKENVYPTHWYGEYHPFEFEFVVNDKIGQLKIFENLVIISNKAEPDSFHFEIEGDNYDFSLDKRAMYFRLEATKELYLKLGSDMLFNRYYTDVAANMYTHELYYRGGTDQVSGRNYSDYKNQYNKKYSFDKVYPITSLGLVLLVKSTIFPLYYERIDTYNDIYHNYLLMHKSDGIYDFLNLSGSEISWNRDLNLFNVITHIKNSPIDLVGRLRGNSRYKEGKWNIQIPSIIFNLKNEADWTNGIPPIIINSQYDVPNDLTNTTISADKLPNVYLRTDRTATPVEQYVLIGQWTYRKEARIRDKWIKIRVRYSGKNLAVIHSLATLYNISYS